MHKWLLTARICSGSEDGHDYNEENNFKRGISRLEN